MFWFKKYNLKITKKELKKETILNEKDRNAYLIEQNDTVSGQVEVLENSSTNKNSTKSSPNNSNKDSSLFKWYINNSEGIFKLIKAENFFKS